MSALGPDIFGSDTLGVTVPDLTRAAALYGPVALAGFAAWRFPGRPHRFAGCLLSLLWTLPTLLLLQILNQAAGWWSFPAPELSLRAMPVELYGGWAVLWGLVPVVAPGRMRIWHVISLMAVADVLGMPLLSGVVRLGPHWLVGEAIALGLVLLPAVCLARWTEQRTHLRARATLQLVLAALLFLFLCPELAFAIRPGRGWGAWPDLAPWLRQLACLAVLLGSLPGISAVQEFAGRGGGTPIPYDPPVRLVTSGIYRYVANPMQLSCCLVLLLWALILADASLLLPATVAVIYSAGLAEWDEGIDLAARFGEPFLQYRRTVRNWLPRLLPAGGGEPARLYLAHSCGPCRELGHWILARQPVGLKILQAETLPPGTIRRLRYVPAEGRAEEGVRAVARALEHIHLGWAMAGAALRLPGVGHFAQLAMDASGFGPRTVPASCTLPPPLASR